MTIPSHLTIESGTPTQRNTAGPSRGNGRDFAGNLDTAARRLQRPDPESPRAALPAGADHAPGVGPYIRRTQTVDERSQYDGEMRQSESDRRDAVSPPTGVEVGSRISRATSILGPELLEAGRDGAQPAPEFDQDLAEDAMPLIALDASVPLTRSDVGSSALWPAATDSRIGAQGLPADTEVTGTPLHEGAPREQRASGPRAIPTLLQDAGVRPNGFAGPTEVSDETAFEPLRRAVERSAVDPRPAGAPADRLVRVERVVDVPSRHGPPIGKPPVAREHTPDGQRTPRHPGRILPVGGAPIAERPLPLSGRSPDTPPVEAIQRTLERVQSEALPVPVEPGTRTPGGQRASEHTARRDRSRRGEPLVEGSAPQGARAGAKRQARGGGTRQDELWDTLSQRSQSSAGHADGAAGASRDSGGNEPAVRGGKGVVMAARPEPVVSEPKVNSPADSVTLKLADAEGNEARVRVMVRGDRVRTTIVHDNPAVATHLAGRTDDLQRNLSSRGFGESAVTVHSPPAKMDAAAPSGLYAARGVETGDVSSSGTSQQQHDGDSQRDRQQAEREDRHQRDQREQRHARERSRRERGRNAE